MTITGTPQIRIVSVDDDKRVQIELSVCESSTGEPLFNVIPGKWLAPGDVIRFDGTEIKLEADLTTA